MSIYMEPGIFRMPHEVLPMPAAVESARSILYFDADTVGGHLATFAVWGVVSLVVVAAIDRFRPRPAVAAAPRVAKAEPADRLRRAPVAVPPVPLPEPAERPYPARWRTDATGVGQTGFARELPISSQAPEATPEYRSYR